MKIGIITQPLHTNYGGLLQNYALQKVLSALGHEVYTIYRDNTPSIYSAKWTLRLKFHIKQTIKKIIGRRYTPSYKEFIKIRQNCISFVENNITTTKRFKNQEELLQLIDKYSFEGYTVGSDQVWRPCYSPNIYNDFLDFCQEKKNIRRIAYAASFGVNEWEFNDEQTKECSRLAKLFDAISVREDSGTELCSEYLGVDAMHVLDPTLLLEKEEYIKLAEQNAEQDSDGNLFSYILDTTPEIQSAISHIEQSLSLRSFQVKAKSSNFQLKRGGRIDDHVIPAPTKWLRAFMDAKIVFTDSFHGCVFSIIFNKPFWVIGNEGRGNARFDSLLKQFNLESRRISIDDIEDIDLTIPIDWKKVNTQKKEWQEKSFKFLKENL